MYVNRMPPIAAYDDSEASIPLLRAASFLPPELSPLLLTIQCRVYNSPLLHQCFGMQSHPCDAVMPLRFDGESEHFENIIEQLEQEARSEIDQSNIVQNEKRNRKQ